MDIVFEEIEIRKRKDRKDFASLPFALASSHAAWRPGLKFLTGQLLHPEKNPFWEETSAKFFIVRRKGAISGRVGLLAPGYVRDAPDAAVFIFPDFIADKQVFDVMIRELILRAAAWGARRLIGPFNPNIHYDVGVQFTGFEFPNYVFMGYQPAYYHEWFVRAGFGKVTDFYAWELMKERYEKMQAIRVLAERVKKKSAFRIRAVTKRSFDNDLPTFYRLYCDCFEGHWGFRAPSWEEFRFIAGDIKLIFREGMILIAEWNSHPVGFVLGVPDLYELIGSHKRGKLTIPVVWRLLTKQRRIRHVRVMIAGVLPQFRAEGIHIPLFTEIAENIFRLGFAGGEIGWVMEGNEGMEKILPLMGAERKKGYRLYGRDIQ